MNLSYFHSTVQGLMLILGHRRFALSCLNQSIMYIPAVLRKLHSFFLCTDILL